MVVLLSRSSASHLRDVFDRDLLGAQLAQCAQPILQMVGLGDLAVANCLYVDCHDPEALAGMGSAEQRAGWSTGDLAGRNSSPSMGFVPEKSGSHLTGLPGGGNGPPTNDQAKKAGR